MKKTSEKGKNTKGKREVSVNMEGVSSGWTRVPEADYLVKVIGCDPHTSDDSGNESLKWTFAIEGGKHKGAELKPYYTSLQPQALFKLKSLLTALGVSVPNTTMKLKLDSYIGLTCGVSVEDETYEGNKSSVIQDAFPWSEEYGEGGESAEGEEEEAGEESEEVDLESMDLDALKEFAKENEIDLTEMPKEDRKKAKKVREFIQEALENSEECGEEEEGGEEAEEVDLEEMELEALKAFAEEREIDLTEMPKEDRKKAKKVREFIAAALESSEEEEEVDLDEMDLDALIEFAKDNGIKLGKEAKKKASTARAAIQKALEEKED